MLEQRPMRMAGATSLETGAAMRPVTSPERAQVVLKAMENIQKMRLPGREQTLTAPISTEFGPMNVTMTEMGGVQALGDMVQHLVKKNQMLTVNPQTLGLIKQLGSKLKGIGAASFEWAQGDPASMYEAPTAGVKAGASRGVLRAVQQAYQQQVIPRLTAMNPGSALLISNAPTSEVRGRLYQRAGMMGPIDPLGQQYSLVLPSGKIQPLELFGGGVPEYLKRQR